MLYYSHTQRFHLFYCFAAIVTVCYFVHSLMAFGCREIKGLLTYLHTYLHTDQHQHADHSDSTGPAEHFLRTTYHQIWPPMTYVEVKCHITAEIVV